MGHCESANLHHRTVVLAGRRKLKAALHTRPHTVRSQETASVKARVTSPTGRVGWVQATVPQHALGDVPCVFDAHAGQLGRGCGVGTPCRRVRASRRDIGGAVSASGGRRRTANRQPRTTTVRRQQAIQGHSRARSERRCSRSYLVLGSSRENSGSRQGWVSAVAMFLCWVDDGLAPVRRTCIRWMVRWLPLSSGRDITLWGGASLRRKPQKVLFSGVVNPFSKTRRRHAVLLGGIILGCDLGYL